MNNALDHRHHTAPRAGTVDWRRRMSDNVAYALIAYTGLQIFSTVHALKKGLPAFVTYLVLILLIWRLPVAKHFGHVLAGIFQTSELIAKLDDQTVHFGDNKRHCLGKSLERRLEKERQRRNKAQYYQQAAKRSETLRKAEPIHRSR